MIDARNSYINRARFMEWLEGSERRVAESALTPEEPGEFMPLDELKEFRDDVWNSPEYDYVYSSKGRLNRFYQTACAYHTLKAENARLQKELDAANGCLRNGTKANASIHEKCRRLETNLRSIAQIAQNAVDGKDPQ